MARQRVWLSYDLGIRGDYVGLYNWLDAHEADECGESFATFVYQHTDALEEELTRDLRQAVEINTRTRIYLVFREETSQKMRGRFIFGRRRPSAWAGYAGHDESADDEAVS